VGLSNAERQARWRARHPRTDQAIDPREMEAAFEQRRRELEAAFARRRQELEAEFAQRRPSPAEPANAGLAPQPLLWLVKFLLNQLAITAKGRQIPMVKANQRRVFKLLHPDHVTDPAQKLELTKLLQIFNNLRIKIADEASPEEERRRRKAAAEKAKATRAAKAARARARDNPPPRPPPFPRTAEELRAAREEVRRKNSERAKKAAAARAANGRAGPIRTVT